MNEISPTRPSLDMTDRVIIITGGATGIGKVYSQRLAEAGAKVVIADINGTILAELPDNVLAGFSGDPNSTWVRPVGWLDAETLIVDVRGDDWADTSLVKVRFDGSNIAYLASGQFEGFTYP